MGIGENGRPHLLVIFRTYVMHAFSEVILLFFIYSVIGWLWESVYCSINAGRFVYRGFLKGPYCPVYGFGVLLVLYIVEPLHETTLDLFIFSTIAVTALEYFTALLLERVFKVSLWNYDNMPLNIQGRVAVPVSVFWGFCCVIIVNYIQPEAARLVSWLYGNFGIWLPALIAAVMAADTVYSVTKMLAFKKMMVRLSEELRGKIEAHRKDAEGRRLGRLRLRGFDRHILSAFPDVKIKGIKDFEALKKYLSAKI